MSTCPDCARLGEEAGKLAAAKVVLKLHAARFWPNVSLAELAKSVGVADDDIAEARRRLRRGEL